jgi:hypothetical protein
LHGDASNSDFFLALVLKQDLGGRPVSRPFKQPPSGRPGFFIGRGARMKRKVSKRELIAPRGDKRYIRLDEKGRIKESDDQGRSLSQDRWRKAKTVAKPGQGDRGDRKPPNEREPRGSVRLPLFLPPSCPLRSAFG